jgi:hypothetical protein
MASPATIRPQAKSAEAIPAGGAAMERHYAPDELGKLWNLSADTVRRLFEREPGVLVIERGAARARRYRTLRIPESVAARVHRRLTNPVDTAQRLSIR